jgi:hypothetical protein
VATKAILKLTKKSMAIESAARHNRKAVTPVLTEKFPQPGLDWGMLQELVARELEQRRRQLLETANAYERKVHEEPKLRKEREAVARAAYDRFVTVRKVLEAVAGRPAALDVLGVAGATPQRPAALLERMREAIVRLRRPERLPTELDMPGMTQDWGRLADALSQAADRLEEVLTRQRRKRRDAELALLERQRAREAFNNTYVGLTKVLDGLYIAADERELAERLRLAEPTRAANDDRPEEEASALPPLPRSADPLGQSDEEALGATHEAEPVDVLVLRDLPDELGTVAAQAGDDVVQVVDGEHDAPQTQRVRRRVLRLDPDRRRGVELRQLDPAVAVRGAHHGDVATDAVEPDDLVHPTPLDRRLALQLHAELGEEPLGGLEVFDDDQDVVHPLERHVAGL